MLKDLFIRDFFYFEIHVDIFLSYVFYYLDISLKVIKKNFLVTLVCCKILGVSAKLFSNYSM